MESQVVTSYKVCRELLRAGPGTVGVATSLLPRDVRDDACALHALIRALHGLVDERDGGNLTTAEARGGLDFWREWFVGGCWEEIDEPIVPAARYTILANEVPPETFLELIDSLESDLAGIRYQTAHDLVRYCYRSGSTMGLAMCYVMGVENPAACARAAELGVGIRLTSVIRDVGEDIARDRVYLPLMDMARHRVSEAHLRGKVLTRGYRQLIDELTKTAEAYYEAGFAGLNYLPRNCRRSVRVAANLHRDILRSVRRNGYDNLTRRAATSAPRAAVLGMRGWAGKAANRQPVIPEGLPDGLALIPDTVRPSLTLLPDASQGSAAS